MKKLLLALCGVFIFATMSIASAEKNFYHTGNDYSKENKEERKAKMEAMKKDLMEFEQKMDVLIEKYNKSGKKEKIEVKKEMKDLVTAQTDKEITMKKEMLAKQQERLDKLEKSIAELESNKDTHIDKKVDFATSREGQKKIKEMKEKRSSMEHNKVKIKD